MKRKYNILYLIVDSFIKKGNPISSNLLLEEFQLDISSATIRNDMAELEKEGYIEKAYKHSGRVPTEKGYKFYINNLRKDSSIVSFAREKIDQIFSKRDLDINETISEVIKLISKTTNTLGIIKNEDENIYIEDLKNYDLKNNNVLIVCVLSNGRVIHENQKIGSSDYNDINKAFKVISKRLIGTNIIQLESKINYILQLVIDEVKNVEFNFKAMIFELVSKLLTSSISQENNLSESFELITKIQNKNEIKKIFDLIEKNKIWDLITKPNQEEEVFIDLSEENLKEISVIKRTLSVGSNRKKIAFIGAKNQDYQKIITMIDLLEEKIKE